LDSKTLALTDLDKDGAFAPLSHAAANGPAACLKTPNYLLKSSTSLPLSAINDTPPEGAQLPPLSKAYPPQPGQKGLRHLTLDDTTDTAKISPRPISMGWVIPAEAAGDPP